MKAAWRSVFALLLALVAVPTLVGQVAEPKTDFVQSLARFSLELDGPYGDEGSRLSSNLESMERRLKLWDATIHTYEAGMASEIAGVEPRVAARLHAALGGIYLDRSRVADALREFVAAGKLDPNQPDIYALQGLADSHPFVNDVAAATQAFRKALDLDARDPLRAYMLALHFRKIGEPEEAKKALHLFEARQKLRSAEPGHVAVDSPFIQLGVAQEQAGVEPFFPPALYAEGFALLQRGEYTRAILQFREAAALDPLNADAVENTGAMAQAASAFREGSLEVAVQHLKVAIELAPNSAEAHRILGRVYLADQQYDKGLDEVGIAVRLNPRDERARLALTDALVETGRYPAAERALQETIAAFPGSGRAHYAWGRLHQRQGQYPEAVREFDKAVTFGPLVGLNSLYQTIGALHVDQQDFEAAIDAYAKRADVHPNDPAAHQDLGRTYVRLGRHDEARAEFAVVLMLRPDHAEATPPWHTCISRTANTPTRRKRHGAPWHWTRPTNRPGTRSVRRSCVSGRHKRAGKSWRCFSVCKLTPRRLGPARLSSRGSGEKPF